MRRENGAGTVIKVKDRKLRKPYKALVTVGYNINGNPKRKVVGYFETIKEARTALYEYSLNKDGFALSKLTFKEVYDKWFKEHSVKVKKVTVGGYINSYNKLEEITNKKFVDLKLIHWQNLFDSWNISSGSKNVVKSMLKEVYKYAIKYEIVDKCQVTHINLGKSQKVVERRVFTKDEIDTLFRLQDTISKSLIVLIYTGMRIGELLNLHKNFIKDDYIEIINSKTKAGERIIPIADKIKPLVESLYNNTDTYLFANRKGTPLLYNNYRTKFAKLMKQLGMQHTVHDTRHTFVSMLGSAGANDVSLAKLAGHSDVATSKNIYSHRNIEDLKKVIELLN